MEPSDPLEPLEMDDDPETEDGQPEQMEETRDDEIIVEKVEHDVDNQIDNPDHDSPLSSPPGSEIEAEIQKTGMMLKP